MSDISVYSVAYEDRSYAADNRSQPITAELREAAVFVDFEDRVIDGATLSTSPVTLSILLWGDGTPIAWEDGGNIILEVL